MNKLSTFLGAALLTITYNASAGDCPALSGKYTIGKTDADFSTVNEAVNALKCGGVSGSVTFLMEDGTYNEKVTMSAIQGADAFSAITFESKSGNKEKVIISYAASDATMVMNGTSWVTFDNITIDHASGTYGNVVRIDGKASHLRFKDVIMNGVDVTREGAESAVVNMTNNAPKADIAFEDCEINNGSIGIIKGGVDAENADTKTVITGTLFFNQYEKALALTNEDAPIVSNNVVSSLSSNVEYKAMVIQGTINRVIISNNIINAANGSAGILLKDCMSKETEVGQIDNNSITVGGPKAVGLSIEGSTDNQALNYNRVKLNITGERAGQSYYKNMGSGRNINMSNNIFYDLNTGGYTILGNTYKDIFNQLPGQANPSMTAYANGLMVEKVSPIK